MVHPTRVWTYAWFVHLLCSFWRPSFPVRCRILSDGSRLSMRTVETEGPSRFWRRVYSGVRQITLRLGDEIHGKKRIIRFDKFILIKLPTSESYILRAVSKPWTSLSYTTIEHILVRLVNRHLSLRNEPVNYRLRFHLLQNLLNSYLSLKTVSSLLMDKSFTRPILLGIEK